MSRAYSKTGIVCSSVWIGSACCLPWSGRWYRVDKDLIDEEIAHHAATNPGTVFAEMLGRDIQHRLGDWVIVSDHLHLHGIEPQVVRIKPENPYYLAVGARYVRIVDLIGRQVEIPIAILMFFEPECGVERYAFVEFVDQFRAGIHLLG